MCALDDMMPQVGKIVTFYQFVFECFRTIIINELPGGLTDDFLGRRTEQTKVLVIVFHNFFSMKRSSLITW